MSNCCFIGFACVLTVFSLDGVVELLLLLLATIMEEYKCRSFMELSSSAASAKEIFSMDVSNVVVFDVVCGGWSLNEI